MEKNSSLDFIDAASIAWMQNNKYDYYQEYENLYCFSIQGEEMWGETEAPLMINKQNGEVITFTELVMDGVLEGAGNVLAEGSIEERVEAERNIMPTHPVRYAFEHRMIPFLLYRDKVEFMARIITDETLLSEMFIINLEDSGVKNPYGEQPIKVVPVRTEDVLIAQIIFPEPESEPLCYESYALYDLKEDRAAYYCIEKGRKPGEPPFLCGWTEDGTHYNYDNCLVQGNELLGMLLQMFCNPLAENVQPARAAFSSEAGTVEAFLENEGEN